MRDADAVSVVLLLIFMTISPLWVPVLMASKAPLSVVKEPEAVPELAVRVTWEKPTIGQNRSKPDKRMLKKRFFLINKELFVFVRLLFELFADVDRVSNEGKYENAIKNQR